jgi:hypothetical protein
MKSTSQRSIQDDNGVGHIAVAGHDWPRPRRSPALGGVSPVNAIDLAITRDWLLGVDRERRNARRRDGMPVRIWTKPVKKARLSVAGLMVEMPSFMEAQEQFVRCYLRQVLMVSGGNVSWAARLARRNRTGFHRLLVKHRLAAADFRNVRHPQGSRAATMTIPRFDGPVSSTTPVTRLQTNLAAVAAGMALR